jgi:intein-encoded DNA endonuclease-like protein
MAQGTTFPLVDRILEGTLAQRLESWRAEGKTYDDIAFLLRSEHDVKVSTATVCRWLVGSSTATPSGEA